LSEVNANDETTVVGATKTISFTADGSNVLAIDATATSTILVSWSVTGAGASFTGVTALVGHVPKIIIVGKRDDGTFGNAEFDNSNQLRTVSALISSQGRTLEIPYDATVNIAGSQAATNLWLKGTYYTVPAGYRFVLSQFSIFSTNASAQLRAAKLVALGTYNIGTASFAAGSSYASPTFASVLEVEVTTATGNTGSDHDINLNITYTNQDGTTGHTATVTIPKNTIAGLKIQATLAAGDYGVRAVTAVSVGSGGALTGAIAFNGLVVFLANAVGSASVSAISNPSYGSMVVSSSEVLALDFGSSAAATAERSIRVVGNIEPN